MNVFELFGTIAIKNRDANAALNDTAKRAERTGNRIQAAFKKIGETSMKIAKPIIAGATAIGTAFTATVESTRDYRTAMAKLDTAFQANGHSAEVAKETYKALQKVLGETDQAVEAANHLAVMCDNQEDLSKWTDICTGVFATFGDSLPIEGLTESANETSKVGQVTGSLADALNWAGISEDDFNKKLQACTSEEKRQELIMDTLYWTYKAASDQYKETGASVMEANAAQEKLNEAMAKLGEIGEPILTAVKGWIADMVLAAVPHIESIITAFSNLGDTWTNQVWPMFQEDLKAKFGIELPDWETFKSNIKTGWEDAKASFKEYFRVTFGVDMPSWSDIASSIASGWASVKSSIGGLFSMGIDFITGGFGFGGSTADGSHASGLERVPRDGYIARVHKDEAILNTAQADVWRAGGSNRMETLLGELVNIMRAGQMITLDSGIMAGQLTPAIDTQLGTISRYKGRGN
jgi:hypothetical protein